MVSQASEIKQKVCAAFIKVRKSDPNRQTGTRSAKIVDLHALCSYAIPMTKLRCQCTDNKIYIMSVKKR